MRLYNYWRSSSAYRVRIALCLKGIAYEYVPVHLVRGGGEQHAAAFRAKSPLGQVPVLELATGELLIQSMAIIEYLEETCPPPPLLPRQPLLRARARALAEIINSGIQPLQNRFVLADVARSGVDADAWARRYIERGLVALEQQAAASAGRFLVGDEPSIADLYLVPQLYNARRFALDLAAYPTLLRVDAECRLLEAFQKAEPERQLDAEF